MLVSSIFSTLVERRRFDTKQSNCSDSNSPFQDEIYLNLVLEYIPETVYKVARQYSKQKQTIPVTFIKLYMYQLFRYSDNDYKQRIFRMTTFLSDHWPISILTESAIAISNLRTCCWTLTAGSSSSVTLAAPSIWCAGSRMCRTSAPDITGNET